MAARFPNIRFLGDKTLAERFVRNGRIELQRTKQVASNMGVPTYSRRSPIITRDPRIDAERSYIFTEVAGDVEIIDIYVVPVEEEIVEEEAIEEEERLKLKLYSGFAYKNWLPEYPDDDIENPTYEDLHPVMQDFQPTVECYERIKKDFPEGITYQQNERLNVLPAYNVSWVDGGYWGPNPSTDAPGPGNAAQTQLIRPCMFSGLLAKAATLALGMGDFRIPRKELAKILKKYGRNGSERYEQQVETEGFQIEWKQRHGTCYGIVKDNSGDCWLVATLNNADVDGSGWGKPVLVARRLPVLKKELFILTTEESAIVAELGGVPTGEGFPDNLSEGISEGWIKVWYGLDEFYDYDENYYYQDYGYGWCFNPDGSEARITTRGSKRGYTTYRGNGLGATEAYHYPGGFERTFPYSLPVSRYWSLRISINTDPFGESSIGAKLEVIREDIMLSGRSFQAYTKWSRPSYLGWEGLAIDGSPMFQNNCPPRNGNGPERAQKEYDEEDEDINGSEPYQNDKLNVGFMYPQPSSSARWYTNQLPQYKYNPAYYWQHWEGMVWMSLLLFGDDEKPGEEVIPEEMEAVIWVGWINGQWSEIYYRSPRAVDFGHNREFTTDAASSPGDMGRFMGAGTVIPQRMKFHDGEYVPDGGYIPLHRGLEGYWPMYTAPAVDAPFSQYTTPWACIPKGYSTELDDFEHTWHLSKDFKYTIMLGATHYDNPGQVFTTGNEYSYIHEQALIRYRPISLQPGGRHYFIIPPFNRNAYFCIDRTKAQHRKVFDRAFMTCYSSAGDGVQDMGVAYDNTGVTGRPINPDQYDIVDQHPPPAKSVMVDTPSGYDGWSLGVRTSARVYADYGAIKKGITEGFYNPYLISEDAISPWTLTNKYAAGEEPPDAVSPTRYVQAEKGWGLPLYVDPDGVSYMPNFGSGPPFGHITYDQGRKLPYGGPGTDAGLDLNPNNASTFLNPGISGSTYTIPPTIIEFAAEADVWLVADRLPSGQSKIYLGKLKDDEVVAYENRWRHEWWCQTAVAGAEAAVFTKFEDVPESESDPLPQDFSYQTAGVHPPLPEGGTSFQYCRLTFVGINGP